MKISIIVPAFNEGKFLGETLVRIKTACGAFAQIGWESELIVCDNNSTDRTTEIARAAGATVVFEPVNQISRARNSGAAAATGAWLVFVDADSYPSPDLFIDMAREIQSGACLAGGATISWDQKRPFVELMMPILNLAFRFRRLAHGAFIFVESAVFRKLGGFSQETFSGEDWELSQRLKQLSQETGKQFVILHKHPIMTSARRMKNSSALAPFWVLYSVIFLPRRIRVTREKARRWYDVRK